MFFLGFETVRGSEKPRDIPVLEAYCRVPSGEAFDQQLHYLGAILKRIQKALTQFLFWALVRQVSLVITCEIRDLKVSAPWGFSRCRWQCDLEFDRSCWALFLMWGGLFAVILFFPSLTFFCLEWNGQTWHVGGSDRCDPEITTVVESLRQDTLKECCICLTGMCQEGEWSDGVKHSETWSHGPFKMENLGGQFMILLMEEILHHLGCIKHCKYWDKHGETTYQLVQDFFHQCTLWFGPWVVESLETTLHAEFLRDFGWTSLGFNALAFHDCPKPHVYLIHVCVDMFWGLHNQLCCDDI